MLKTRWELTSLTIALAGMAGAGLSSGTRATASLSAQVSQPAASPEVIIYHAGSLTPAFDLMEIAFAKATGIHVNHRGMGSVEAARRITFGKEPCDIYASADYRTIDAFLKPTYADYNLLFAQGGMVLTYTTASRNAASIADPNGPAFRPPASIPNAVPNWYTYLTQPGVKIGGSDPSADPGGYRALMVMQLAQYFYGSSTLYQDLFRNHMIVGSADTLGVAYDYQFAYEHMARASAAKDPSFRYVRLPPEIDLSSPAKAAYYGQSVVSIAGLASTDPFYEMRGTRAMFGLTVLKNAPNRESAIRFLQFMLSAKPGEGVALQTSSGPDPITTNGPAWVSLDDYGKVPASLIPLVRVRP
jgi:molybdate/tungstate transport system substrate-binding protein